MVVPASDQKILEAREYVIPRYAVDHLLESFKIVRTELSEVLEIPDTNRAEWSSYAEQWWTSQPVEDQHRIRSIVAAMGAPVLVSNVTVMRGNEDLINTRAILTSARLDDPAFLVGVDEEGNNYRVTYLESGSILAATLMMYLDAGAEFGGTQYKITLGVKDLIAYLGLMDLYRRSTYIAMLEHTTEGFIVTAGDILKSVQDGVQYPDLRWTLPFAVLQITNDVQPPTEADVNQSIQTLVQRGVLKVNSDGQTYSLTEPGLFCAKTMMNVHNKLNVMSVGMNEDGRAARKGAVFIRADPILWVVYIEPGSAIFSSVDLDTAAEFIKELLTPSPVKVAEAKPQPAKAPSKAPTIPEEPARPKERFCPSCGQPATWIEQYQRWYCYGCQKYLEQ